MAARDALISTAIRIEHNIHLLAKVTNSRGAESIHRPARCRVSPGNERVLSNGCGQPRFQNPLSLVGEHPNFDVNPGGLECGSAAVTSRGGVNERDDDPGYFSVE
jgi:hypothetical protein